MVGGVPGEVRGVGLASNLTIPSALGGESKTRAEGGGGGEGGQAMTGAVQGRARKAEGGGGSRGGPEVEVGALLAELSSSSGMYVCVCVYAYVCVCVWIYIHTHRNSKTIINEK
jgi:hypothetical protein